MTSQQRAFQPAFGIASYQIPPVADYSRVVSHNGVLDLRKIPPVNGQNRQFDWLFVHRPNAYSGVHALTLVNKEDGVHVRLLKMKRPPMGGRITLELPAGLWGDQKGHGSLLDTANMEVQQEVQQGVHKSAMMAPVSFAVSPGMSTEFRAFAIAETNGQPSGYEPTPDEKDMIVGFEDVPMSTFLKPGAFKRWLNEMDAKEYIVGIDVIAARGLLPLQPPATTSPQIYQAETSAEHSRSAQSLNWGRILIG